MKSATVGLTGKILRKPWYVFWKFVERNFYHGREYSLNVPYGQRIYTPWFVNNNSSEFARFMQTVRAAHPLLVSPDRCYMLYQFCRRVSNLDGDIAECGVYTGGTAHLLSLIVSERLRKPTLHLFDSFEGMPASSVAARDYHSPGDFADTSLPFVTQRLSAFPFVQFHAGFIPGTFEEVQTVPTYCFVHVDVDIYPSVLDCCKWFWPRLCSGGVMIFDDYGFFPYRHAARAAVDEYFAAMPADEQPIILPTGQAIALKS